MRAPRPVAPPLRARRGGADLAGEGWGRRCAAFRRALCAAPLSTFCHRNALALARRVDSLRVGVLRNKTGARVPRARVHACSQHARAPLQSLLTPFPPFYRLHERGALLRVATEVWVRVRVRVRVRARRRARVRAAPAPASLLPSPPPPPTFSAPGHRRRLRCRLRLRCRYYCALFAAREFGFGYVWVRGGESCMFVAAVCFCCA